MEKAIKNIIKAETKRQNEGIELIASENYASKDVRDACASILTNKYAEGYPHKRYYGGCEFVDQIEDLAIERVCKLFNCKYANVQPHSGSQANAAAYEALQRYLGITDRKMKILSMDLNSGSHLTHGSPVSFSSKVYDFSFFDLGKNGRINYNILEKKLEEVKPDVLLSGYSAYPYEIDFAHLSRLAKKYKCLFMVDMAHIAGLVAADEHMSPLKYADIVTSTTHKTLRGPRGGIILTNNEELIKKVNSAVFPYYQGGPLEHIIAAKATCFKEADTQEFRDYIHQVKVNTKACQQELERVGAVTTGTDNHLFLLNTLDSFGLTGLDAQKKLEEIGITTNKNMIPGDTLKPNKTSGLRIGFAAITTRGCTEEQAKQIAKIIYMYLKDLITIKVAKKSVKSLVKRWKNIEKI